MSKEKKKTQDNAAKEQEAINATPNTEKELNEAADANEAAPLESETELKMQQLADELAALNDKYLRTVAEYDNFRKRTAVEKRDLMQYGGERIIGELLPVIDDLDLAMQNIRAAEDVNALREGIELIMSKFQAFLQRQGVAVMDVINKPFDAESQQAIAMVPVRDDSQKGIVIDCTKKGYTLHEKVIRHADVVVGQ